MSDPQFQLPESINLGDVFRGDTIPLPVWVAVDYYGNVINLAGASIWFTAKTKHTLADDASGAFQQSTATTGVEIVNPATGEYRITIESTKTSALTDSTAFFWDVQVRTAAGVTTTVKQGVLNFIADYTRAIA